MMKHWTDDTCHIHYRLKDESNDYIELEETDNTSNPDNPWLFIDCFRFQHSIDSKVEKPRVNCLGMINQKQAGKLAELLNHFAKYGTLPVPPTQKPPKDEK